MGERGHHPVCGWCQGTGRAPLGADLAETLEAASALTREGVEITAAAIRDRMMWKKSPTTVNNRLVRLCAFGLLHRSGKRSRSFLYQLGPAPSKREGGKEGRVIERVESEDYVGLHLRNGNAQSFRKLDLMIPKDRSRGDQKKAVLRLEISRLRDESARLSTKLSRAELAELGRRILAEVGEPTEARYYRGIYGGPGDE